MISDPLYWEQRPLSDIMIQYASQDVLILPFAMHQIWTYFNEGARKEAREYSRMYVTLYSSLSMEEILKKREEQERREEMRRRKEAEKERGEKERKKIEGGKEGEGITRESEKDCRTKLQSDISKMDSGESPPEENDVEGKRKDVKDGKWEGEKAAE